MERKYLYAIIKVHLYKSGQNPPDKSQTSSNICGGFRKIISTFYSNKYMVVFSEVNPCPFVLLKIYVYSFKDESDIQTKVLDFMSFKNFKQRKSRIFILF